MTNLTDKTIKIRYMEKGIVNNSINIGFELKEIRDTGLFKEKFDTFTDYLKEEFPTYSEGFVSRLLKLVEDPKLVSLAKQLGVTKTMELIYVPNREVRDEIASEAVNNDLTREQIRNEVKQSKTIERFSKNLDNDTTEEDSAELKTIRTGRTLLQEITNVKLRLEYDINNIKTSISKWNDYAVKYPDNSRIQEIFNAINKEMEGFK